MALKWIDELVVNEEAQDQWRHDAELRKEFREFSTYLAFMKAEARGAVKIVSGRTVHGRLGITDGNARHVQRQSVQSEDRKALKQWVQQTLQTIRAQKASPLTATKPYTIPTLDGPRFSDGELLGIITSEKAAAEYWEISPALQDEFPSSASVWHFVKGKRERMIKKLR